MHHQPDLDGILDRKRPAPVIAQLDQPGQALDGPNQLTAREQAALVQAIAATRHPLRRVALGMLENWDTLAGPDQSAGLLHSSAIARNPGHQLDRSRFPISRRMRRGR